MKKQRYPPENSSRTRKGSKYFSSNLQKCNKNPFRHLLKLTPPVHHQTSNTLVTYLPMLLLTMAPTPSCWGRAKNFLTTTRASLKTSVSGMFFFIYMRNSTSTFKKLWLKFGKLVQTWWKRIDIWCRIYSTRRERSPERSPERESWYFIGKVKVKFCGPANKDPGWGALKSCLSSRGS